MKKPLPRAQPINLQQLISKHLVQVVPANNPLLLLPPNKSDRRLSIAIVESAVDTSSANQLLNQNGGVEEAKQFSITWAQSAHAFPQ